MAYTEIATSGNSAVVSEEQWNDLCHREYVGQLKANFLIGASPDSVIYALEDLSKKGGDAITVRYASAQAGGTVRGNAKLEGNEGSMAFYAQRFVIDNARTGHLMEDVPMTEKRVSFSVKNEMKYALTQKHAETLDDDIVSMLCDASVGRVRGRYLYGATDGNWNATHSSALTALATTTDNLSGAMISIAKRKALIKGTGVSQRMRPTKIKNGLAAEEWFMFLAHPYCIRDLVGGDAAYRAQLLLIPPRANADSIYFSGSHFKGSWEGVLVYEYDRMPLVSSDVQVGWCLLLGAKAGVIAWGQRSKFTEDTTRDFGHDYAAELHDIRNKYGVGSSNMLKSVYNDGTNEQDYGLVNVFANAISD